MRFIYVFDIVLMVVSFVLSIKKNGGNHGQVARGDTVIVYNGTVIRAFWFWATSAYLLKYSIKLMI